MKAAVQRAADNQTETHKAFIRSRWMPAWIDSVEYAKFGRATVTATLFGGMDESQIADFTKDVTAYMNASENTLKHAGGTTALLIMLPKVTILEVIKTSEKVPLGSSGIQIRFETDLIIEGIRPGRIVRIRPASWPQVDVPREEFLETTTPLTKTGSQPRLSSPNTDANITLHVKYFTLYIK